MRWNVLFVAATLLVATSLPSAAQISIDMNKITCGRWLGYSPEDRDFVRFWMSGYYNSAANSTILNYDRFQRDCQYFCVRPVIRHEFTKRSLNMTANCVFASAHSRGGRFHLRSGVVQDQI